MQPRAQNIADYRRRASLELLARDLDRVMSVPQKKAVSLELMSKGLMTIPWYLRILQKVAGDRKWKSAMEALWDTNDTLLDGMWRESQDHMLNGKDLVDPKSAGGYNRDEMQVFTDIVDRAGYRPGNVIVMSALQDGFFLDTEDATAEQLKREYSIA